MRIVATRLQAADVPFAFVGGAVVCVLVDDPTLTEIRPTKDVDVIVEILTRVDYYALEERLRAAGFQHDISEGAPISLGCGPMPRRYHAHRSGSARDEFQMVS
jgi:hypothetical protein